ncbi:MAG: AI-2E family transporter [Peptococcaceae bacterium]|nr:AI-2E family transporter [Peptococcaceae bacterium]
MRRKSWRWLFTGACLGLLLAGLILVRSVLGPFVVGFALAYTLNPLIEWLENRRLTRKWAIALVFCGIIAVFTLVILWILPVMYTEIAKLSAVLPQTMEAADGYLRQLSQQFRAAGLPNKVVLVLDEQLGKGEIFLAQGLSRFLGNLPERLTSLSLYIFAPFLAVYFLADWQRLTEGFWRLVPEKWRLQWMRLCQDISHVIRGFIRGNLIVAVIVGVLVGIGMKLIGMEYALLIGVICGAMDLIPYFGPLIGGVPTVLLGLIQSPVMALKVVLVILVVQQLEGNLISPKLMGMSVGLHPLLMVFVLLAGGELAGFWGLMLAVPVAAVVRIVVRFIYLRLVAPQI